MKKLFSLLVLIVAIVTGAWADVTVYVKAETAPYLYAWDGAGGKPNGEWPGAQMEESVVVKETTFWKKTFATSGFNIIFSSGDKTPQTPDISGITSDRYFTFNATDGTYVDVTEQYGELPDASVTSLKLAGNHANWASGAVDFTEVTAGTEYSITVDLTNQTVEEGTEDEGKWRFKFIANGGMWFGFSNVTFDGGQPSWVGQGPTDDNFEINLNNETLTSKIFIITATWGGGKYADKNWTVKIENAPAPEPENVEYFMVGSMNDWTKDNVNQLLPSKTEEGLYELVTTFAANDEFKIVSSTNVWYPEGMGNNYVVSEAGTYTISFRPEGNVEGWYGGYFNVVKNGGDDPVETRTIYLKPGIWTADDARFAANVLDRQDQSKNSWADFEPVPDAAGYYMTEIPADASMVRMYRFDPATTEDSAEKGAFWNRTDVIMLDATNDLFKITAWPTADGGNCAHVVTSYPETYYNVNVAESIENGEVTVDPTSAAKDDKVTVTATPNEGYELSSITVTGVTNNEAVKVADDNTFAMIADDVTVSATFKAIPQLVGYYVVGNMTDWTYADAYQMTPDNENLYQLIKEFKTDDEIKVRSKMTEGDGAWYPSDGDNFKFTQDGEYTITFNPKGNVEGWHGGYFNVVMKEEPTPQPAEVTWQKTDYADLQTDDIVVIVDQTTVKAMSNDKGTTNAPTAIAVTLNNDKSEITGTVANNIQWTVTKTEDGLQFGVGTKYLYCTNSNNGVRVGDNTNNVFSWKLADANSSENFLFNNATSRYLGVYSNSDWRCYTTVNANIKETVTAIYKKVGGDDPQPAVINSMAIKGTFPGMENWEKEVPMTQDAANTNVWTLTMDNVTVEGKKYEYKAFANGETTGYQLPAEGNADFVFGTDMYPAGTYTLTFTANTKTHSLTLDAKKNGIETIKELNAQANGTEFSFVGNATVVAKAANGTKTYVYIKDETGSSLIYDVNGGNTANLSAGNVITAPWKGKVSIYNNLFEAVPAEVLGSTSTVEVTIPEATATDVKKENMNQVVLIKGLTIASVENKNIKFTIGNAAIAGYNQFGVEIPAEREGKTFDVVGSISIHNENIQFQPITITESEVPPVEVDTYAIVGDFTGGWPAETGDDGSKDVQMTQSPTSENVYTLEIKGFLAEAKKYEYKLRANKSWEGYQLPAEGNANFVFGTADYPAGVYDLTFTANIAENTLQLQAVKSGISTIAELNMLTNNKEFIFDGNATVVAKAANGTKTYVYIKDETGSSLIYDVNGGNTANLSAGNVITAPWKGKVSIYNNLFEAVPAEVLGSTSTVEVTIPEATATDVKKENMNQVVLIKGLTIASVENKNIKFTIGNAAIAGYNQFGVEIPAEREGKTFDVVGSISIHNENIQFQPITITESAGPVADTWTVAGSSVTLFGTEWDTTNEANDMTLTEGLYVWEKKGVELTKSVVKFKVVKNHAWDESYPADDYVLNIPADGTYDVMITFNAETHEVNATTTGGPELNTYTASFENTGNWTDVYAYTFSKNEGGEVIAQELGAWPGVKLTAAEGGAYQVVIQAASAPQYIIFHNNAGVQTADLPFENGKTYGLPEEQDYTVQFVNLDGWNNVNAYAWSGNVKQLGEWPGTQMTVVDTQVQYGGQNYPVYQINFKASVAPEFIIFNNGDGMQTEDLVYVEGKQYLVLNMKGELACSMKEPMQLDYSDRIKIHNGMPKIIMGVPSETETVKINVGDAIHIRIAECPQMRSPGLQLTSDDGNTPITENLAANLHEVPAIITIPVTGALYEWMKDADHKVRLCGTNVFIDRMTVEAGAYEETATTEEEGTVSVWVPENEEGQQVAAEETIEIPATSFIVVDVKKDDIVKIKASGASAPSAKGVRARGAGRLTIIETVDIEILKKGTTDKLVADEKILISEDGSGYEFVVTEDLVNVLKTEGFDIRNKSNNPINIEAINVKAGGDVPVNYSQSINIEQLVLDNGKTYDIASALLEKYIESANINALDSLNDEKVLRNEPYLGLKLKTSGAYIKVNVEKGKTLKVKLGYVAAPVNVTVNGVDATPVEATNESVIEEFAAADVDQEVVFTTTSDKTVVLKQIMIGEDIADVTLPPATKYEVSVAEGIENGTVTFEATSKTDSKGYVTVAVGDEVTVTATPDPGFELSGITVTGVNTDIAVIVNDGKFIMPEDAVTINAIFTTVDAIIGVKDGVRVSTVKYVKNGKLVIATPEGTFSGTGKRVK